MSFLRDLSFRDSFSSEREMDEINFIYKRAAMIKEQFAVVSAVLKLMNLLSRVNILQNIDVFYKKEVYDEGRCSYSLDLSFETRYLQKGRWGEINFIF